jgi:hypothetical protein
MVALQMTEWTIGSDFVEVDPQMIRQWPMVKDIIPHPVWVVKLLEAWILI